MAKDKWIQEAHLKKGAFTKWAERHGYSTEDGIPAEAIAAGKRSDNPSVQKMANLADVFRKMANRRKNNQQ